VDEARRLLVNVYSNPEWGPQQADSDIHEMEVAIRTALAAGQENDHASWREILVGRYSKGVLIAVLVFFFQQMSGINGSYSFFFFLLSSFEGRNGRLTVVLLSFSLSQP
jgi:hypothetical protein